MDKLNSIIYLIVTITAFYIFKDAFFARFLIFSGKEIKIDKYNFKYEEGKPKITFSYYNDFEKRNYQIVQNLEYESVKKDLQKEEDLFIRYNKYYPEHPYILKSPIYLSLFLHIVVFIVILIVFLYSIKEILWKN